MCLFSQKKSVIQRDVFLFFYFKLKALAINFIDLFNLYQPIPFFFKIKREEKKFINFYFWIKQRQICEASGISYWYKLLRGESFARENFLKKYLLKLIRKIQISLFWNLTWRYPTQKIVPRNFNSMPSKRDN